MVVFIKLEAADLGAKNKKRIPFLKNKPEKLLKTQETAT
jgi:hypothetical protein